MEQEESVNKKLKRKYTFEDLENSFHTWLEQRTMRDPFMDLSLQKEALKMENKIRISSSFLTSKVNEI